MTRPLSERADSQFGIRQIDPAQFGVIGLSPEVRHIISERRRDKKVKKRHHPTALYRFFDSGANLLYVGISYHPFARWHGHRQDKPWWVAIAVIRLEHFDNREAAETAEKKAIRTENPRYNIQFLNRCVPFEHEDFA